MAIDLRPLNLSEFILDVCAKFEENPSRRSLDTMFMKMGQTDGPPATAVDHTEA